MNARIAWIIVIGVAGGLLPWAEGWGGFDDQLSGRQSEIVVGEDPAPLSEPVNDTVVSSTAFISDAELARDQLGFADGDAWEQEYAGPVVAEDPCRFGHHRQCPDSLSPEGTISRVLLPVDPRWEAQVDALLLWQGNIASRPLYVLAGTTTTALNANQAQTPLTAGPRFGLLLNLDPIYSIEGNYFNVQSFGGQPSTVPTAGG